MAGGVLAIWRTVRPQPVSPGNTQGTTQPKASEATRTFALQGFSFDYPAGWSVRRYVATGTFMAGVAKLSSQGFPLSCTDRACVPPKGVTLRPGGIFGWWEVRGWPGWDFGTNAKGTALMLGGHDMRVEEQAPQDWCWSMGGTTQVTVYVDRHLPNNWFQFTSCQRAPTTIVERQLHGLLASLRWEESA
jgi:hypothetical protein